MTALYEWHKPWLEAFGSPPTSPTSREESAQEVLSNIFLGLSPAYFLRYAVTPDGERVVKAIWAEAFGSPPAGNLDWLVSEYELPVPREWREETGLSYRAPDLVCGVGSHILILELKTEWRSYSKAQISDFFRLARRLHPDAQIDLILLEERLRGAHQKLDARQRYAELTWAQVATVLRTELPDRDLPVRLASFIDASLPGTRPPAKAMSVLEETAAQQENLVSTAIDQALHIAPAIELDPNNKNLIRGIDVPFGSESDARDAEAAIRQALVRSGHHGVTTWLWRGASGGVPATPAGRDTGIELRLQHAAGSA